MSKEQQKHKNDIYGDLSLKKADNPAVPAATVILAKDGARGVEILMLRRNSKIAFGGMWVFPGGRIDEDDYEEDRDLETAARNAAARESMEEAGIQPKPSDFTWISHWTPPASTPRRYATWFFLTEAEANSSVQVDQGEIEDHAWISPREALRRHNLGEIDLAPPTWVTLYHLGLHAPTEALLEHFSGRRPRIYETHLAERSDGIRVAMWEGDAGYYEYDADAKGFRHRLTMDPKAFHFEHSSIDY